MVTSGELLAYFPSSTTVELTFHCFVTGSVARTRVCTEEHKAAKESEKGGETVRQPEPTGLRGVCNGVVL